MDHISTVFFRKGNNECIDDGPRHWFRTISQTDFLLARGDRGRRARPYMTSGEPNY
jgi:hypothetical protein